MPCFTGKITNQKIIIKCAVGSLEENLDAIDYNTMRVYNALVDTGATITCISPKIVTEVGLANSGWTEIIGVGGVTYSETHIIKLIIGIEEQLTGVAAEGPSPTIKTWTAYKGFDVEVANIQGHFTESDPYDMILGMDIIKQ